MDLESAGKLLLLFGLSLAVVGGLLWAGGRLGLGSVPGNFNVSGQGWSCLLPIGLSILLSLVLTIVLNVILRFFNR
jgi:hypothetical protein